MVYKMIPIYKPYISKYKQLAIHAIHDEWISNHGTYVENASNKLKDLLGTKYCILMNNGTSATQCLLYSIKFKYPDIDTIYVPNNVFIAPINCVLNIFNPSQIEVMKVNDKTLNIDTSEEYIQTLKSNSAILIVHNLGNIINVPRLKRLRPDLIFVEDNCEGIFGKYENKYSGSVSLCSALSFYGNKTITTGEGGAFLTNDTAVYNYISKLYSHGMTNKRYIHDVIGHNYRMTNIQAAFLYEQLNDIDHILEVKKNIFKNYKKIIHENIDKFKNRLISIEKTENTKVSKWMFCMVLKDINYDVLNKYMNENGISIRPLFYDLRQHTHLQCLEYKYEPVHIFNHGFFLPSYPELSYENQLYIINIIIKFLEKLDK